MLRAQAPIEQHLVCRDCGMQSVYVPPPALHGFWTWSAFIFWLVVIGAMVAGIASLIHPVVGGVIWLAWLFQVPLVRWWRRRCISCGGRALVRADSPVGKKLIAEAG